MGVVILIFSMETSKITMWIRRGRYAADIQLQPPKVVRTHDRGY